MRKVGKNSFSFDNVYLISSASFVGPKEKSGPIGKYFDGSFKDLYCEEKTWEKAEMALFKLSLDTAISKGNLFESDIDVAIGGDLNNQIIIGSYVFRDYNIPYLGVFSACSCIVETLIIGSTLIEGNFARFISCSTSSHNATAEKQFRYPTEYGGQKPASATLTVTAAATAIIGNKKSDIKITKATVGRVLDGKFDDPIDLGRAMAPSAYHTLRTHFEDFDISHDEYDLIVTGDLSYYGKQMVIELFKQDNVDIATNYEDCGLIIYNRNTQDVLAGGSGCGCVAAVTFSYLINKLKLGVYKKILVVGTGALLNPIISAQNETIPGISHAIVFERMNKK